MKSSPLTKTNHSAEESEGANCPSLFDTPEYPKKPLRTLIYRKEVPHLDEKIYAAIDLKSFYASVECVERGLDPMTTNLVVADQSRTEKTICLAVSPSLKACGISGRARLFEVVQKMREINTRRLSAAPGHKFTGTSVQAPALAADPSLEADYLVAVPRMAFYIEYSTRIYSIYLKYVAPEDIHVYSIDEVFIDLTAYLHTYECTAYELTSRIMRDILAETGITATAGLGTNLYLCKVAMDISAKHIEPDAYGVRIAALNEYSYRRQLWTHRPLTDFWRVGPGYARKLEACGIRTMGDIARCSVGKSTDFYNEELLYSMFGVNAGLLIDHAWGWEPCTIADIKAYRPREKSLGAGQVLHCPYTAADTRLIVREMADSLVLDLVGQGLVTDSLTLTVGYDGVSLQPSYRGEVQTDRYGRKIPKHAHGTTRLERQTASEKAITPAFLALYDRIINPKLMVRRLTLTANRLAPEEAAAAACEQLNLFDGPDGTGEEALRREKQRQQTVLSIRQRFGKNAIIKGMSLQKGATMLERNKQIGGHKA